MRFRWLPADRARHAIVDEFPFWGDKRTLCGLDVTIDHEPTKLEWLWWTCPACDRAWRDAAGNKLGVNA
ncbi:zinc-finger [Lentzea fradiae]|uniref:Zinc-finger n=1 Tax=Lentzea fradiae TaxID=200378 RepID=A0A1G7TE81_9PSEU|nr:zinc finger protein [Lentzea fradiae]SDG33491.1 zinc-finger [Lentzea fradiae]